MLDFLLTKSLITRRAWQVSLGPRNQVKARLNMSDLGTSQLLIVNMCQHIIPRLQLMTLHKLTHLLKPVSPPSLHFCQPLPWRHDEPVNCLEIF